jgi:hypothetical protein
MATLPWKYVGMETVGHFLSLYFRKYYIRTPTSIWVVAHEIDVMRASRINAHHVWSDIFCSNTSPSFILFVVLLLRVLQGAFFCTH